MQKKSISYVFYFTAEFQDPSSNSVGSSDAQAVVNSYEAAQMGSSNEPDTYYDDNDEHYDPEQQISVLHPDHPLMARFQNRLRTLLTERHTKIDLELRELTEGKGVKFCWILVWSMDSIHCFSFY